MKLERKVGKCELTSHTFFLLAYRWPLLQLTWELTAYSPAWGLPHLQVTWGLSLLQLT